MHFPSLHEVLDPVPSTAKSVKFRMPGRLSEEDYETMQTKVPLDPNLWSHCKTLSRNIFTLNFFINSIIKILDDVLLLRIIDFINLSFPSLLSIFFLFLRHGLSMYL